LTSSLDGTARIWSVATGELLAQPMRHSKATWFAYFSPDGRRVATASEDSTSRLWDAASGYPVGEPIEHKGSLRRVQFSADGRRLFTGSDIGSMRISDNPTPPPAAPEWFCDLVEALAGRRLDPHGNIEPVSHETLGRLRDSLTNSAATDFYSRWAHWFFVERSKDSPFAFTP
jgi:WD domain, G-beta repeat